MISLHNMWFSNASITSALSAELIAVFVKVMNRIDKTTLKQFVKHVCQFCFYFLNHSHKVEDHITADCKVLNIKNQFIFIRTDMSLICTVNKVCQNIKRKEKLIQPSVSYSGFTDCQCLYICNFILLSQKEYCYLFIQRAIYKSKIKCLTITRM